MKNIQRGFTNSRGTTFNNIRNIHFDNQSDLMGNLGILKAETTYENGVFITPNFRLNNGVYIYQTYDDKNKAFRIYKDYADYRYTFHNDDALIAMLQERQHYVQLTEFPTGIVTIDNKVIGQEIPFYDTFSTISKIIMNKESIIYPTILYLEMLKILKELLNCGIVYTDVHPKNFMADLTTLTIKLIDFESEYIAFNETNDSMYHIMMENIKNTIKHINKYYGIVFDENFNKIENVIQMEEYIQEKHYSLIKKIN